MIDIRIPFIVDMMQKLDEMFPEKELPSSFMISKYALKQLIYELQRQEDKSD